MQRDDVDPVPNGGSPESWSSFARAILSSMHRQPWAGWLVTAKWKSASTLSRSQENVDLNDERFSDKVKWRPRTPALLASLRIAKTFGNASELARAIGTHRIVSLVTGSSSLDKIIIKVIEHIASTDNLWPRDAHVPVVMLASEVNRIGAVEPDQILSILSERARDAFEQGAPIVFVSANTEMLPRSLRDLAPSIIALTALNDEMLPVLFDIAYPDQDTQELHREFSFQVPLARLSSDQICLALRASEPATALQTLRELGKPRPKEGLGLAAFPLPKGVRAQVNQLISDLIDWKNGRIPWGNVSRGILLVGPPGSGKTQLARLIAEEAGVTVISGSLAHWSAQGSRSSETLKAMRAAFNLAAERAPSIVFIDEIDAFGDRNRAVDHNSAYTDYVVTALLDAIDGYNAHEGVVVVGATNHLTKLDKALTRPGRFDQVVFLGDLSPDLLPLAIRWHLGSDLPNADLLELSKVALGMSGADIAVAVRAARAKARWERRDLIIEDLALAMADICPPLPAELRYRLAIHEAGHAIVAVATGRARPTVLAIGSGGGFTHAVSATCGEERADLQKHLAVCLAGRAAEILIFGHPSAMAGGDSESDLAKATKIAAAIVGCFGLGSWLSWQGSVDTIVHELKANSLMWSAVESSLSSAERQATEVLEENRGLLESMAAELVASGFLLEEQITAFTSKINSPPTKQSLLAREGSVKLPKVPRVSKFPVINLTCLPVVPRP